MNHALVAAARQSAALFVPSRMAALCRDAATGTRAKRVTTTSQDGYAVLSEAF